MPVLASRPPRNDRAARLAALRKLARSHGGRCLSPEYLGLEVKLEFECRHGHRFTVYPERVFVGSWCAECRLRGPDKLKEIQQIAAARGGTCLSEEYRFLREKMRFRCAEGHEWEARGAHIKEGGWCPRCRGRGTSIDELKALAAEHGFRCLSARYRDDKQPMLWECDKGHRFNRRLFSIKRGGWWCPRCRTVSGAVARALAVAEQKGGALMSTRGIHANARLRWRCARGHEWVSKPVSVATGRRWCRQCHLLGIEQMQALAAARDGKCLSTEYVGVHSHLLWECEIGHRWWATPSSIKHAKSWCPDCARERAREAARSAAKDNR